ncbi:NACHT domain-containing protein [Streptomyces sp. H39-S7]|uniref:NACHT domain-containing protein n=1 Tax=Streptomyces sp. H39-S7 TaxID=3004357 RepID=UPI0022AE566B|nr:NACHT domain-containing protein [Streptomyces sp. H39-S7]MCZ4121375.1 NACHT domain-containing protein [Streptomyces sp. H39-S7]
MLLQSAAANYTTLFTMFGAITAALIAGAGLLYQIRRTRALERDKATWTADLEKQKVQYQLDVDLEVKRRTWNHEQETAERERRRAEAEAERERERAAQLEATVHRDLELGAAEYCEKLAHELSMLRILDLSRPLDLKKLYVQVRVQEQVPLSFLSHDTFDLVNSSVAFESKGSGSVVIEPVLLEFFIGHGTFSRAAPVTLAPMEALQRHQRIVVVGDPGAGKTTMLRHLAFVMASQRGTAGTPDLPAYVELNHFMANEHTDLLDYLAEFWADRYGFAGSRAHLESKLTDGTAALLLDGLDEVLGGGSTEEATAAYNSIVREVNRLATRFPRALIAVTCRRHGWRGGLQPFQVMEALDFGWPQIKTFIANWFGAKDGRSGALMHALSGNSRLQTLAANPLLLSLIAIVYERDLELPERRAALYRRCVEVMLREWDAHRQISRYSRFTTDNKQDLLKQIAWHYHRLGQRYFAEDDLLELIADYLPTIDLPPGDNRAILDEIAAQYGLLKAQAHGWYGFLHLTLQEHFAATALWELGPEGIELATAKRYDPWWEEVVLLLAGSLPDATPLLVGLLQLPADGSGREGDVLDLPDDDLFHTDLLIAASCLPGSPRIADARLRQQIVRSLWRLCETTPYWNERDRAAQVLVALLGSGRQLPEVINYIADDQHRETTRMALVTALGTLGGRGVGERLLGLLALRPDLSVELRQQIVWALGRLRVAGAVPALLRELTVQLARPDTSATRYQRAEGLKTVAEALGATGGPADTLLLLLDQNAESTNASSLVAAVGHALLQLDDPAVPDLILRHVERRGGWSLGFGTTLAGSYLEIVGEPGFRTLLDTVLTGSPSESEAALIMGDLADFVTRGHGRASRDDLLTLAHDDTRSWQVRWLAMDCLEHLSGNPGDLAPLVSHTDRHVAVSAAVTLAAWGAPDCLPLVQEAILEHDLTAALGFFLAPDNYWTRSIVDRVARALTAYHDPEFSGRLARAVPEDEHPFSSKACWLGEFNPEASFDRYLHQLSVPTIHPAAVHAPWELPPSRVPAALAGIRALHSQPAHISGTATSRLLSAISEVGDDTETVVGLLSLVDLFGNLRHFADPGDEASQSYRGLHRALYAVSRRARVRVLKDGTVVPITSR